jgi:hypothetical protein
MRDPAKARNGRNPNSRRAYRAGGDRQNLRVRLLLHLIADARAGKQTANMDSIAHAGTQYGTRIHELKKQGWIIANRKGWHWIDVHKMRETGRHDLLAVVFPEKYPDGPPKIIPPLPPLGSDTIPMFGDLAPESYGVD